MTIQLALYAAGAMFFLVGIVLVYRDWRKKHPKAVTAKPGTTVAATESLDQRLASVLDEVTTLRKALAAAEKRLADMQVPTATTTNTSGPLR